MAYPGTIYAPRAVENLPGISYDETKKSVQFAEDYALPAAEIVLIETTLGVNPQGAYASVAARLADIHPSAGGGIATSWFMG